MAKFGKYTVSLVCITLMSGCAYTQQVAQSAYDDRARQDCFDARDNRTIQLPSCQNGLHVPVPKDISAEDVTKY